MKWWMLSLAQILRKTPYLLKARCPGPGAGDAWYLDCTLGTSHCWSQGHDKHILTQHQPASQPRAGQCQGTNIHLISLWGVWTWEKETFSTLTMTILQQKLLNKISWDFSWGIWSNLEENSVWEKSKVSMSSLTVSNRIWIVKCGDGAGAAVAHFLQII